MPSLEKREKNMSHHDYGCVCYNTIKVSFLESFFQVEMLLGYLEKIPRCPSFAVEFDYFLILEALYLWTKGQASHCCFDF